MISIDRLGSNKELITLIQQYYAGLWTIEHAERYGFLVTGNPCIALTPEDI